MKDPNKSLRNLTESVNRLYEQTIPAGGGNGFGQTDPTIPSIQQIGDLETRERPRPTERVTTRALRGSWPETPPFLVDSDWAANYEKWVATGDTSSGIPHRWPDGSEAGFPPPMISNPAAQHLNIEFFENQPGGLDVDSYLFWFSFLNWFVGSDEDMNGVPDEGTPYDMMMQSIGQGVWGGPTDFDGAEHFYNLMQAAAHGSPYAINWLLGQVLYTHPSGTDYWGDGHNWYMHVFFGQLFWGQSWSGNPDYWRWYHYHWAD